MEQIFHTFTPELRNEIPEEPGVYLYKNQEQEIIYIGKAKNLRKRVSSYFIKKHTFLKTHLLVTEIRTIDVIVVSTEREALLLEATLIKQHLPRFNISFKDGKFYPYIKVTKDKFPRMFITRNRINDGSRYFGPYVSAGAVHSNVELIQNLFGLRTCRMLPKKECLEYHMGRCSAPCIAKISEEDYHANLEKALILLENGREALAQEMEQQMKVAAKNLEFEKASLFKERRDALLALEEQQHVFLQESQAEDFIALSMKNKNFGIAVSLLRKGKLTGKLGFTGKSTEDAEHILEEFILSQYGEESSPPAALIIDNAPLAESLSDWFKENKIPCLVRPPSDEESPLLKITARNAALHLERLINTPDTLEVLKELQLTLGLKHFPSRIEGFDIAKLDGSLASGVMVCFIGGEALKSQYRLFNIRGENQQDDFAGMEEILSRRLKNGKLPQLFVIDGGKGQLQSALKALKTSSYTGDVLALSKQNEEIWLPSQKESILLAKNSPILQLLQRIRDESHRFSQFQLHRRMQKKMEQ